MGTRILGGGTSADTLATFIIMSNKSFISDPGVSCVLLAYVKLWQATLLVYK